MRRFSPVIAGFFVATLAVTPASAWTPTTPDAASVASFGGPNSDEGTAIAVDGAGNSFLIGTFRSTADFDPGSGTTNVTAAGNTDGFITKFNAAGSLVWVKTIGGASSGVRMTAIATDIGGHLYVTGSFDGTVDLDLDSGAQSSDTATSRDSFILKLDSNGNLVWKSIFVGTNQSQSITRSLAIDKSGNVVAAGDFTGSVDFDPAQGTSAVATSNGQDAFIAKLNAAGQFVWVKPVASSVSEIITTVKVDSSNNVVAAGVFQLTVDFDPGSGINNLVSSGQFDTFVLKLDSAGNFVWARSMGGSGGEDVYSLAIDSNDAVIIAGVLQGSGDFDPGAGTSTLTTAGGPDGYIVKLNSAGIFVWAERFGGSRDDEMYSISVDGSNNVYATGFFESPADYDPGPGTSNLVVNSYGIFVLKVNAAGSFQWARALGGASFDQGNAIAADAAGNTFITGAFNGTSDFDPGTGTATLSSTSSSFNDVFLVRLDPLGTTTIDSAAPTASWSSSPSISTSRTLTFTLTFNEFVSGINSSSFENSGTATGCVFTSSASSTSSSVTVSVTCSSDGTVIPRLKANAVLDSSYNNGPSGAVTGPTVTIASTTGSNGGTSTTVPSTIIPTTTVVSVNNGTNNKKVLPATGSSSFNLLVIGLLMVGLGLGCVEKMRRSRVS